jgi:TM2 domain-containing membrane protein YozV
MKIVAIIVNLFFPGFGSFFVGKWGQAIGQILMNIFGVLLILTAVGAIIGIPLCIGAWIWGLVTAANSPSAPVQVTIVHQNAPASAPVLRSGSEVSM